MKKLSFCSISILFAASVLFLSCGSDSETVIPPPPTSETEFFLGADLSYLNEMLDCGGTFRENGAVTDPYQLFAQKGCKLVRVRLWHNPSWTDYSDLTDVTKTIQRAKSQQQKVLLDFHYSDTWADPGNQTVPAAWEAVVNNTETLGDSLYNYTFAVLETLYSEGLTPDIVQIGNETNAEILQPPGGTSFPIRWNRNVSLLNKGIKAVTDFNASHNSAVQTMLHIAQPENAFWFFTEANAAGIAPFDWIGLSYYPKWSEYGIEQISGAISNLKGQFNKRIMIVETAYPHTLENADAANNNLWEDALLDGFPATPQGQLNYLNTLARQVANGGGEGLVYWEPAWISTSCNTLWGTGSHWDNATFFDAFNQNEALPAFDFFAFQVDAE